MSSFEKRNQLGVGRGRIWTQVFLTLGFPGGSVVKNPPANAGDSVRSLLESERFAGEGNGSPLQCSCLGSPMDRGAWRAPVHGVLRVRRDSQVTNHSTSRTLEPLLTAPCDGNHSVAPPGPQSSWCWASTVCTHWLFSALLGKIYLIKKIHCIVWRVANR